MTHSHSLPHPPFRFRVHVLICVNIVLCFSKKKKKKKTSTIFDLPLPLSIHNYTPQTLFKIRTQHDLKISRGHRPKIVHLFLFFFSSLSPPKKGKRKKVYSLQGGCTTTLALKARFPSQDHLSHSNSRTKAKNIKKTNAKVTRMGREPEEE